MATNDTYSPRRALLDELMAKVENDRYPSSTMLDMIEGMLAPDDVRPYSEALMSRVRDDRFPSISLMRRVQNLG